MTVPPSASRATVVLMFTALAATSLGISASAGAQAATRPVTTPLPAASSVRTASAAADLLRELYFTEQFNDGMDLGSVFTRRFPSSTRTRAWYVANLTRAGFRISAESLAARIDTTSHDPWLLAALAHARLYAPVASKKGFAAAHRLALRARALAPRDPDLVWLAAYTLISTPGFPMTRSDDELAYLDSVAPTVGNPAPLRLLHADALLMSSAGRFTATLAESPPPVDTAKRAAAFREYAGVRDVDPGNFLGYYSAAVRLQTTREDTALLLMKRAVALAPRSVNARTQYWRLINAQRGLAAAQKREMIAADRAVFLAQTDSAPWALAGVAGSMRYPVSDAAMVALEDRILAKVPRSTWAEDVLYRRATQWNDSLFAARDTARPGPKSDSIVVRKRYLDAMEAFIAKPWIANPTTRGQAIASLFFYVRDDSTYPTSKMITLIEELSTAQMTLHPAVRYGYAARVLAERKVDFRRAEQLARDGLKQSPKYLEDMPGYFFTSVGDQADSYDRDEATMRDILGVVFYNAGHYADADKEIGRALELNKKDVGIYRDLGRLRVAQGRDDDAELAYAQGMTVRVRGVNPNQKELEAIYQKNHGSMEGWSTYLGSLIEKERATRRAKILATREKEPKSIAGFTLPDLEGKTVVSDTLSSRYVVVNFWGMWCGPCVAEMPELQQFYDKFRGDKSVSVFTISNDKDLQELKDWMAKRKLTIPTLFDDGYVANTAQIHTFPTTWFIDREGKLQFRAVGNTGALVDEWTWRLEAMRAQAVTVTVP
jgi:thiol-disulfide isomerase/thioredoxin/tetratricopeptide (TPR) repeat protein